MADNSFYRGLLKGTDINHIDTEQCLNPHRVDGNFDGVANNGDIIADSIINIRKRTLLSVAILFFSPNHENRFARKTFNGEEICDMCREGGNLQASQGWTQLQQWKL